MLKVQCAACGAPYDVDERRVPPNGMKMRCPACGASVHVSPPAKPSFADLDFELDLPQAKVPNAQAKSPGRAVASLPIKAQANEPEPELSDLPALKRSLGPSLSASAEGDLADLPLPKVKPSHANAPQKGDAPRARLAPSLPSADLGGEDPGIDLPAPKNSRAPAFEAGELDLPAPKRASQGSADLELDLPAPKRASQGSADLELDLPAPKKRQGAADGGIDLPAPKRKLETPFAPAPSAQLDLPKKKAEAPTAPPKAAARDSLATPEVDLPAPKKKNGPEPFGGIDLPAPKPKAPGLLSDLPAARPAANLGFAAPSLDLDLPAPKGANIDLPAPKREYVDLPALKGANIDLPVAKSITPAKPSFPQPTVQGGEAARKSFAKPPVTARMPLAPTPEARPAPSAGTLPKDSLALDPKPFFEDAPQVGMFGKLDEVGAPRAPDLIDLPAPQDLPAVKRPAPKATALGLGQRRDPLELPAEFGAPERNPSAPPSASPFGNAALDDFEAAPAPTAPSLADLDLPAPRDLPAVKKRAAPAATALGLGMGPLAAKGAEPAQNHLELSLELPPILGRAGRGNAAPLGEAEGSTPFGSASARTGSGELDLTPRSATKHDSLGDLEPIVLPSAQTSNTNTLALHTLELAPDDLMMTGGEGSLALDDVNPRLATRREELGLELRGMSGLADSSARNTGAFGELDLAFGREPPTGTTPLTATVTSEASLAPPSRVIDAEVVPSEEELALREERRKKSAKRLPGWAIPLALVAGLGTTGVAMGLFTDHGYFGVYLLEELLPAAGDPERVRAAIASAEQKAQADSYVELRKALVTLSDARNEAGLNRRLLARSLLHENLYQLRFGEDAQSAQRSAAILARAMERGSRDVELTLGRAADAARRGELSEAKNLLDQSAELAKDPYHALLRGELALLEGQASKAVEAFEAAAKSGAGARAQFGITRAQIALGKLDEAAQAAEATLGVNPRHVGAHLFLVERALSSGDLEAALDHVRVAAGQRPVDGVQARPSKAERARAFGLEGRIEEQRDHPREAQAAYERALAADPLSVDILLGSGRMLMRLGRPQEALSRYDSALSARPSDKPDARGRVPLLEAGTGAIQAMLALQRPKEALARSSSLLAQFPNEPDVKLWHGHVLMALERWEEAEATFRDAMEKAPKSFAGYVGLSQLLFKRNRPEEAARVLSLATGRVDDSAEVRRMLGHSELARNHLPEAVHQFEAALRFDPRDAGSLFGLVVAKRKSGAMEDAEKALAKLEEVDPTFPGLALEHGLILESRGAYPQAIATYRKALEQRPNDSELNLRLGAVMVTAGEIDEAEAVLTRVLKERPNSAEAEHYLGRVLFARNETAQAAQRFERAVNNDMLKAEYHMYLAWALLEQGNFGGALNSVHKAIERDPNLGDARWLLGRIQLRTGAVRDALVNFQAALRLKPGRTEALANMGDAYDELRDSANAIKSYQEALKKQPQQGEWWYRLGQLQLDRGKREEARVALAEAVMLGDRSRERPPWLAEAHRLYGDVLRESKRAPEANDHYKLFLELAPLSHPDRAEIEQLLYQTRDARR